MWRLLHSLSTVLWIWRTQTSWGWPNRRRPIPRWACVWKTSLWLTDRWQTLPKLQSRKGRDPLLTKTARREASKIVQAEHQAVVELQERCHYRRSTTTGRWTNWKDSQGGAVNMVMLDPPKIFSSASQRWLSDPAQVPNLKFNRA